MGPWYTPLGSFCPESEAENCTPKFHNALGGLIISNHRSTFDIFYFLTKAKSDKQVQGFVAQLIEIKFTKITIVLKAY